MALKRPFYGFSWKYSDSPNLYLEGFLLSHIWATELQRKRDDKIQANASQKVPFWRLTDLENELMVAEVGGGGWGGTVREFGIDMYTLLYNQQGPTVEHRELCSVLCGSLDGRAVWGRMDTCICPTESLHCSPETVTTLLISYTSI